MTRSRGSQASARGPRTGSGSTGCWRCSPPSATHIARSPAVHVVGTNGKSTATVTIEQDAPLRGPLGRLDDLPARPGLERAAPDRRGPGDLDAALSAGPACCGATSAATQFEAMTAAALRAFSDARVDVVVVEAGLGGRFDATNVVSSRVVLLTNVGLEHTDVLGDTVEEIATEKLAVVHTDNTVVILPDDTFRPLGAGEGKLSDRRCARSRGGVRRAPVDPVACVALPGRLERRPGEIRDGAHNPDGVAWLGLRTWPDADYTICASILEDKDVDLMLRLLAGDGKTVRGDALPRASRSLPAADLAERARPHFAAVEAVDDPSAALRRAHARGEPVLVTGSLYLLADLEAAER